MSRDHRKLRVFVQADSLALQIYRATAGFPFDERHGLVAQLRRAAVSVAANLVEGSARRTTAEYRQFVNLATGSAAEAGYLVDLSHRLGYIPETEAGRLIADFTRLVSGLAVLGRQLAKQP